MRVVVTRPASDAATWVAALEAAGHSALSLPLIDIAAVSHSDAIDHAWTQWPQWQAAMFVSAQAVRFFFARQPQGVQLGVHLTRCWATGPGTRKALLQAGVPPSLIDSPPETTGQFDSEALWQGVTSSVRSGVPVLVVRGTEADRAEPQHAVDHTGVGRDWLSQQLLAARVPVHYVVVYQRQAPAWTDEQRAQAALAASDGSVWLLSSSQAVANLHHSLPQQDWSQARGIATHARIAQAAHDIGFAEVRLSRPVLADVMASLESLA